MNAALVVAEFLRQASAGADRLNLTALWRAGGGSPEMDPGEYAGRCINNGLPLPRFRPEADDSVTAVGKDAVLYILDLDERLEDAYYMRFRKRYRHDPEQALVDEPTPLMAMLAMCDEMIVRKISPREARRNAVCRVIHHTLAEGMTDLHAETIVARAQRALANEEHP